MPKITVVSGGTATNELTPLFSNLSKSNKTSYILPISDNGGSTSELIRVIGGPAIGDIRSRLTRLIPSHQEHIKQLLTFRLSSDPHIAKHQWNEIVEGTHELWTPISSSTKEIFRSFFVHLHVELLKRSRIHQSTKRQFRYELASVGNMFLTGVRLFIGSLDSSIELFCKLTDISTNIQVLPCINTNFTYHISALLENGLIITGQSQISHPSTSQEYPPPIHKTRPPTPSDDALRTNYFTDAGVPINEVEISKHQHQQRRVSLESSVSTFSDSDEEESGNVPQYTHPELKKSQLHFNKSESIEPLLSPIKRIFYVSPYGEEICPTANGRVTSTIANSDTLIYSIGSLMTSIAPVLVLKGVGKAITTGKCKNKILLLNGCLDRETFGMTAYDFVKVIVESTEYSLRNQNMNSEQLPWNKVVTHLIYMSDSKIDVDVELLNSRGVACVEVSKIENTDYFDLGQLEQTLADII
ncbi:hypothetical protein FOB58_004625 [Candida parapsilosis]|uniref:Uncharacterized protein n=2 Tax=Candida parapsilosis TaxID=5480 RepID=G8B8V4_CANPC|nr:uncharacterized protein CPAR2_300420 [Candida parapsilosis]KAF6046188.1 hypothetical protein FOB58_004625 [Candida parapsilosis]KAF6046262.1 hypothetical protein FOB59_003727 [Candida parapsilosis]KAF6051297.1 hypothetical protein FOB60_003965 [Candida parapsilosis]KAF6061980.1 hypothetical protein FOB61_003410 [Candida parapsilosis]KAI5905324.1 Uncharacterized protein K4G60_g4583 [Candida parapsilosis]